MNHHFHLVNCFIQYVKASLKAYFRLIWEFHLKLIAELCFMIKKHVIIIFLFCSICFQPIFAQSFGNISNRQTITNYIDSSNKYITTNPSKAIEYANKLLDASAAQNNSDGEISAYKIIGSIYYNNGEYKSALTYYNKALKSISNGYDSRKVYDIYKLIGLTKKALGKEKESKAYFETYLQKAIQYKDSAAILDANNNLALFYMDNQQYDQALEQSLGNQRMYGNSTHIGSTNPVVQQNANASDLIIGKAYYLKGDKKNALSSINNSLSNSNASSNSNLFVQPNEVKDFLKTSDSVVKQLSFQQSFQTTNLPDINSSIINTTNYNTGLNYLNDNNNTAAIRYLESTVSSSNKSSVNPEAYKALATAYEKNKSFEKAIQSYKKYIELINDQINNNKTEAQVNSQLNSTIDLMNKKVELLEKEKNINSKNIELLQQQQTLQFDKVKNRNNIIYILCFITLILVVVVYFIIRTVNEKRTANLKLEMKSLRSQMNPHFVFNALNSVNNFISQNDERAANRFLSDFAMLMRKVLNNAEADFIQLSEEISLLQHYLKLEHHRFKDAFEYSFTVDELLNTEQIQIPSMLVQPFVENAIWHGLRYLENKGTLEIKITHEQNNLVISIKDDGIGRTSSQQLKTKNQKNYHSIGIKNIYKRIAIIQQLYKIPVTINIQDAFQANENGHTGTIVTITYKTNQLND